MNTEKPDKKDVTRKLAVETPMLDVSTVGGALAGTAAGALGGPVGMIVGGAIGTAVGLVAGATLDREAERRAQLQAKLDAELGVEGGDIGARQPREPSTREEVNPAIADIALELGEGD